MLCKMKSQRSLSKGISSLSKQKTSMFANASVVLMKIACPATSCWQYDHAVGGINFTLLGAKGLAYRHLTRVCRRSRTRVRRSSCPLALGCRKPSSCRDYCGQTRDKLVLLQEGVCRRPTWCSTQRRCNSKPCSDSSL